MTPTNVKKFQNTIYAYYDTYKRDFPWRKAIDAYGVFVSEVMLQQTQTDRVAEKYPQFISQFPSFKALAHATTQEVLKAWQGLGYNRRALFLHRAAQHIIQDHKGKLPRTPEKLSALPGIGPATARSILAFAFNLPEVFIETNIRSVFIHEFFKNKKTVSDKEIAALVKQTLDTKNPRKWYNALMDYGVMLKKKYPNPNLKSRHYTKQSPFEGSNRKIRGSILKLLIHQTSLHELQLRERLPFEEMKVTVALKSLIKDGLVKYKNARYFLPS